MELNKWIKTLPETGVSIKKRVADFLADNPDTTLIRLDQDLMNMPLPPQVTNEMKTAVDEVAAPFGVRLNSPWHGYDFLRRRISLALRSQGANVLESDVFITSGLESAHACLAQLFGTENNVLLTDPCPRNLLELHQVLGRSLAFARATPENNFLPLPDDSTSEDMVYLASPHPVTGVAMDRESLKKWVDWANERDAVIFFDASLSEYVKDDTCPRSIFEIEGAGSCAIELFSFEKGYGVRELKIAYVIIPATLSRCGSKLRDLWCTRQPATATPPSYVMQKAAELLLSPEAREGPEKIIHRISKVAKTLADGLTNAGIPCVGSETSPFLWAQCPEGFNSWSFFDALLKEGVVVTPGTLFGYSGEGFFRLASFGLPDEAAVAVEKIALVAKKKAEETSHLPSPEETAAMLFEET